MSIDKAIVLRALRDLLADRLRRLTASQGAAESGATHEETRQEHPKDTRAIEAQYLARGLATRVAGLRETVATLGTVTLRDFAGDAPIGMTALVTLADEEDRESLYLLLPVAGGETVCVAGRSVQALTPASPLGQLLIDRRQGDSVELARPAGKLEFTIIDVR